MGAVVERGGRAAGEGVRTPGRPAGCDGGREGFPMPRARVRTQGITVGVVAG